MGIGKGPSQVILRGAQELDRLLLPACGFEYCQKAFQNTPAPALSVPYPAQYTSSNPSYPQYESVQGAASQIKFVSQKNPGSILRPLPQHNAVRSRAPDNASTRQTGQGFNCSSAPQNNGQSSDLNIIKIDPEKNLIGKIHNCDKIWAAIKVMLKAKPLDLQVYRKIWGGTAKQ